MSPDEYAQLLRDILVLFVGHPADLRITHKFRPSPTPPGGMLDLLVRGHAGDQGRLIGSAGRNAIAFQTVLAAIAIKENVKLFVQVLEPSEAGQSVNVPFVASHDSGRDDRIKVLLASLCGRMFAEAKVNAVPSRNGVEKTDFYVALAGDIDPEIEASMNRIFRGIGKNMGRMVGLHICPSEGHTV